MKFFDEWKLKRACKKSGRLKEYEDYLAIKKAAEKDKLYYQKTFKEAEEKFNDIKTKFAESSPEYKKALENVNRWKYTYNESVLKEDFIRPNNPEDIRYRKQIIDSFNDSLKGILGDDSTIRFHGTPIYFAKEILKSGGILSSAARYDNYNSSTDLIDEISVTSAATLSRTLSVFTDFYAFQHGLPAGCLFVLRANNQEDPELAKYDSMKSFSFFKEPERLLAICTTPENLEMVKIWLEEYGYDKNIAYEYEEFLSVANKFKKTAPTNPEDSSDNLDNGASEIDELMTMLDDEDTKEFEVIEEQKGKTR